MQAQPQQPSQAYSYGMQTQQPQYYTLMPAPGVPAATAAYVPYAVAPAVAAVPGSASTLAGSGQGTGLRNSPYFGAGYGQGDGQSPLESPAGYPEMVQGIGSGSRGRPTVAYMAQPSRASVPRFPPQMTAIAQMPTVAALPYPAPSGMYQQPYVYAAAPTQSLLRPKITHGLQQDVGYLPGYNMNFPFLGSPSSPGPVELDDTPITNIYIRGLPSTMTDEQLHEMCKGYGHIVSSKAIIDIRTNECKGYGFVMYETQDQARQAMSELSRTGYQVSFAKESFSARLKNLQDSGSTNIYLSNIPMSMTEEGLAELFSPMKVVSQKILRDNNGVSRGVGFIR